MTTSSRRKKLISPRSFLWQIIRSPLAHGSMPCWGIPFEAIAANLLIKDREARKKKKV